MAAGGAWRSGRRSRSRARAIGFLGSNGAGNTATLYLLLNLRRSTRGYALMLAHESMGVRPDLRHAIGYPPGELPLYER